MTIITTSFNEENIVTLEEDDDENKENVIIICYDPNNELLHLKQRLYQINHHIIFHTKLDFVHYISIKSITNTKKSCLVTSHSNIISNLISY